MLQTRDVYMSVKAYSFCPDVYKVVFNYNAGNMDRWNIYWDEPPEYESIEIADVFAVHEGFANESVFSMMSDEEVDELLDILFAMKEDGE